jgi:hypothetical protein
VGDEEDRPGERVERCLERLAALEVEVVRRLVEEEQVRARGDDEREREAPERAATERSCISQPENRKRPSRFCACGRWRPVSFWTSESTVRLSSSSISCCEK